MSLSPPSSRYVHVLLIDDHALIRAGLRMVLAVSMPGAVVLEAGSVMDAVQRNSETPDVILLDIELPGLNGIEGLTLLRKKWPDVPVLVLSSNTSPEVAREALARGAASFISKAEPSEKIVAAIHCALRGGVRGENTAPSETQPQLTARQCEVLTLMCQGLSNKLIGKQLDLSEHTVRGHVQRIFTVLQVTGRTEAAFAARQSGLVR